MDNRFEEDINKVFQEYIRGYWGNRETVMSQRETKAMDTTKVIDPRVQALIDILERVKSSVDDQERIELINAGLKISHKLGRDNKEAVKIGGQLEAIHWMITSQALP